ncbi:MAG: hypothetical protein ABI591_29220 [Kofleriaceae bacterium]
MAYRNDVDALEARKAALQFEVDAKGKERDEAARLLGEAKARAKLPVLDNLRVATPCHVDWDSMTGDDRVRNCDSCKQDVFNLSLMSRDEAEALLRAKTGGMCVRYFQRHDGTIMLADCTIGKRRRRNRRLFAAGAALLLGGGAAGVMLKHRADVAHERGDMIMGAVGEPLAVQGQLAIPTELPKESK